MNQYGDSLPCDICLDPPMVGKNLIQNTGKSYPQKGIFPIEEAPFSPYSMKSCKIIYQRRM